MDFAKSLRTNFLASLVAASVKSLDPSSNLEISLDSEISMPQKWYEDLCGFTKRLKKKKSNPVSFLVERLWRNLVEELKTNKLFFLKRCLTSTYLHKYIPVCCFCRWNSRLYSMEGWRRPWTWLTRECPKTVYVKNQVSIYPIREKKQIDLFAAFKILVLKNMSS